MLTVAIGRGVFRYNGEEEIWKEGEIKADQGEAAFPGGEGET